MSNIMALTSQIVSAYARNHQIPHQELPMVISTVRNALANVGKSVEVTASAEPLKPAVPIKKSVAREHITCLDCGQQLKVLRRHLRADHNMTPEEYRAKWGLPHEYPMVAPDYAAQRSEMAKKLGLGKKPMESKVRRGKGKGAGAKATGGSGSLA